MIRKEQLYEQILEQIDLTKETDDEELQELIRTVLDEAADEEYISLSDKIRIGRELFNSFRKLDVLQELLEDDSITEIMVNGIDHIFYEKEGRIFRSKKCFLSQERLLDVIQQIVGESNRYVNEASPIVDARLKDGSRVTVTAFAKSYAESNIVYLGAGLETAYDRLSDKIENRTVHWYEADLPEVIEARKKVFGQRKNETLIAGDMFKLEWVKEIDNSLPTLLIVSGVFQYFHEEEIIAFIKGCGKAFPKGEMLFDATSESGLKFTNWFIKRTGNASAIMYFGINDSKEFANKCSMELLEEKTFFPEALKMLGKKLSFVTKVSMKVAEKKKQVIILRLKLN